MEVLNELSEEYNKLSDTKQKELIKKLKDYAPYLKRMCKYKKYELSEEVEQTLLAKDITSGSAWVRFYEENMARLEYEVDGKKYNDAEISKLCTSKDEQTRLKAGYETNRVTKENAHWISYCYNMIMKDKAIEDEKRGFKLPMSSRNLAEEVSDETVECLANTVRDNYKNIAWKFYQIKAKLLGKEKIDYWKETLNELIFYSPHSSFIINFNYIKSFNRKSLILSYSNSNVEISIAPKKQQEFRTKMFLFAERGI